MADVPEFVVERLFDAPRDLVWRTWTEPDLLARWYGPGVETIIHKYDLRPGGVWLNEMRMRNMSDLSRADFTEVVTGEMLVWHHSSTDKDWNVAANQMMPDWPRVLLTTVTFADEGGQTRVKLVWQPHDASKAEIACFNSVVANMGKGWEAGFTIIDEILAELQSA